jgi:uncharacterized membrane protein YgcG
MRTTAALLLLGLLAGPVAADPPAASSSAFLVLPPAPSSFVTDGARLLSPEASRRIEERLKKLKEERTWVVVYVYTLSTTHGRPATSVAQELYRLWKMRDRELWNGLATIFIFSAEREARLILGQGAPPGIEESLTGVEGDLRAIFTEGPEAPILRVIDRIEAGLAGSTTWLDSPPIPADPGGPVYGNSPFEEPETRALAAAVERASKTSPAPIVLVLNPAKGMDSSPDRAGKLEAAWPGKLFLAVFTSDFTVALSIPDSLKDRFPEAEKERISREATRALANRTLPRTLSRLVGEIGAIAEGHLPPAWIGWKHPFQALAGGEDEEPMEPIAAFGISIVALLLLVWFLHLLITNPLAVVAFVAEGVVEGLIGGAFGGGSGGGGGFSGGGGSFGGGGASGSW